MTAGEILTKGTIWASIVAYLVGVIFFARSVRQAGKEVPWEVVARVAYTLACASLLAHVALAFAVYHGWSHAAAYLDTARQTDAVVGIKWGGGLYINYVVLVCWTVDVLWWWRTGLESYRRRSPVLVATWHAFLIFIIFNATVVFGHGATRWLRLAVCVFWALAACSVSKVL
jgi:hypothetical protein